MTADRQTRKDTIIVLLRTLRDVGETLQRGDGGGKMVIGSRAMEMPAAYQHGHYFELLEALAMLRRMGPRHYWHISERFIRSERLTRNLIYREPGRYFDVEEHVSYPGGERYVRYAITKPLPKNYEVLTEKTQIRAAVIRKPGDPKQVLVRAALERWNKDVEARPLELALDFLLSRLPKKIKLPREVKEAYGIAA